MGIIKMLGKMINLDERIASNRNKKDFTKFESIIYYIIQNLSYFKYARIATVSFAVIFLVILVEIYCYYLYSSHKNSILHQNEQQMLQTSKIIAKGLEIYEKNKKDLLETAAFGFKKLYEDNKNPTSKDLQNWAEKLNVSGLSIFMRTDYMIGKMVGYSSPLKQTQYDFYTQNYKLTESEEEATHHNYHAYYEPFRFDSIESGEVLHSTLVVWYGDNIQRWLNTKILNYDLEQTLKYYVDVDESITAISILSPSGKEMFSSKKIKIDNSVQKYEDNSFITQPILTKNKKISYSRISFGDIYNLNSFQTRHKTLLNKKGEFFYILEIEFDNTDTYKQIKNIKFMYLVIGIMIILIIKFLYDRRSKRFVGIPILTEMKHPNK